MKKVIRRPFMLLFLSTLLLVTVVPSVSGSDSSGVNSTVPVEIKYIGKLNNQPLLLLSFAGSPEQNDFNITIRDEFNEVLYRENIRGEHISKKFLLNTDELGDASVFFEIRCRKSKQTVVYEVNRNISLVELVAISELR